MKKHLLLFLAAFLPMMASANDSGTCGDNLTWTYVEATHTLTISGVGSMANYDETTAPWYSYRSDMIKVIIEDGVTSIGDLAFSECSNLASITIPNSVTSIGQFAFHGTAWYDNQPDGLVYAGKFAYGYKGTMPDNTKIVLEEGTLGIVDYAFYKCSGLTSITIPSSVTSIGLSAFQFCSGLTSITIPNSVTSIGNSAFYRCSGLTSITIPNSVTSIEGSAFEGCSNLTAITIPNSVTSIGESAFYGCSNLTAIIIPNSVKSIGMRAFVGCSNLTSVTIPNSVTSIGDYAFSGCRGLASITIGSSVTSIGTGAFASCSGLTSITIPNSVKSIGEIAFYECNSLTSITIGNSVTSIENGAFGGCRGIRSLTYNCKQTEDWFPIEVKQNITEIYLGNDVTSIGSSTFSGCSSLTSITIPNSVTSIGQSAFSRCSSLTSITIPNSVTSIGVRAFQDCSSLTSITIPNSVTSIGQSAFQYCYALTSVHISDLAWWCNTSASFTNSNLMYNAHHLYLGDQEITNLVIPDGVTTISSHAFRNCTYLTSVTIPKSLTSIENSFENCSGLANVTFHCSEIKAWFSGFNSIKEITIGDEVTSIGDGAFRNCSGLTSITIPNSVTSIGGSAFYGCSSLTSITIPNSVKSIGNSAFYDCSSLTSITIPNSVTSIGNSAFYDCSSLTSITIPNSVTSIESEAFYGCSSLTSIMIPNSVTCIGVRAFQDCSSLTSITIPNSVTSIGESAFSSCSNLTSITIGNSVTSIGDCAFYQCSGLTSITIPNSVTSIGKKAFHGCSGLTSIHIPDLSWWCKSFASFSNSNLIDNAHHLYLGNQEITNLVLPDGITTISSNSFKNCVYLTSITIPNCVTNIGGSAFYGCDNIMTVNSEITEPFSCGRSCFSENTLRKGTLYVPAGTKDLYTRFDGWREFLKIEEVGGEPQMYNLSFVVNNNKLLVQDVEEGTTITPPTKDNEGNTITWYTYPKTMPAHDLVVYGMVVKPAPTKYTLTYKLDGQQYKQLTIEEGAAIVKEPAPYKEGYTFGGWQNEPTTMPGKNVTVNGSFTINSYRLSFITENKELSAKNLQYGSAITAPETDSDGNKITWYTYPSTMPAHDLVIYGMVVKPEPVPEPEIFVWLTIKDSQGTTKMRVKQGNEQELVITPEEGWKLLTVTMDGTDITAQIGNDGSFTTPALMQDAVIMIVYEQEVPSEVAGARQSKANVKVVDDGVIITNAEPDTRCVVYQSNGQQVTSAIIDGDSRKITLQKGQVYILTIGDRTLKFAL